MEDGEGVLSFDFEGGLDTVVAANAPAVVAVTGAQVISTVAAAGLGTSNGVAAAAGSLQSGRRNYRQTVCRHWLRGLCMKGDACGFLHQLDRSRMPVCRFFSRYGECHEPDCVYKHTYEDIKECNMYKMGFCPNGPECRYRHIKLPGPIPPLEESLQKIQVRTAGRQYGRHTSQRQGVNSQDGTQIPSLALPSSQPVAGAEDVQIMQASPQAPPQEVQKQQQESQLPLPPPSHLPTPAQRIVGSEQQIEAGQSQAWQQIVATVPGSHVQVSASTPLPQGFSRYFIVKSSNRENLELSVARGLWATHRNNESKLNEAFDSCDNVILIFSVNETGHFQGCARMMSKIGVIVGGGGWKYAHGTAHYGRNFRLKWLKLSELSFNKTRHLRNPYKENLPVKISRDCQELEPSVGEQLATLLYMEPDSELMKIANETELKWEEEKEEGGQEMEDTTAVPFDVVEEDQEEEESDDDDSSNQTAGASRHVSTGRGTADSADASRKKGRGRGRNGTGDIFGVVGYERFAASVNGLKMPPGAAPGRGFPTYPSLPRFGGHPVAFGAMDGAVLAPGMVLPGRPPSSGLFVHGMMGAPGAAALMSGVRATNIMAASRPPFLGGPGRPGTMPFRPPQAAGWVRRDQPVRRPKNETHSGGERLQNVGSDSRNTEKSVERDPGTSGEAFGVGDGETNYSQLQDDADFAGESYGKEEDDSLSEDEAPRRSRHGEARKRRRD